MFIETLGFRLFLGMSWDTEVKSRLSPKGDGGRGPGVDRRA